jgi:hypothetical protein
MERRSGWRNVQTRKELFHQRVLFFLRCRLGNTDGAGVVQRAFVFVLSLFAQRFKVGGGFRILEGIREGHKFLFVQLDQGGFLLPRHIF